MILSVNQLQNISTVRNIFAFYTIALSFEQKENLSDKDNEYPVRFRYFAKLFQDPRGTYFNRFCKDQELGLINYNVVVIM